jgi:Zn-dependent protease
MGGGRSIQLLRVFGVRIGVDASWFVVLFLLIWWLSGTYGDIYPGDDTKAFALATASALLFFVSVLLHELGHAVVAMRNGIGIAGIDLWIFGGVARMQRDTNTAWEEFKVAIAGPLVTLAIVLACIGLYGLVASGLDSPADALGAGSGAGAAEAVLAYLMLVNAILLVFNLMPGFPLDGGRIVRAIAWWRTGNRASATRFAARLGRGFAYLLIAFGVFSLLMGDLVGGVWSIFLGMVLGQAARGAELQTNVTSRIEGVRVEDVMDEEPVAIPQDTTLERALDEYFLRYRWPWFPVVDQNGLFVGLLIRERVEEVAEELRARRTVREALTEDSRSSFRIGIDEPLESLLSSEALQRLGAVMAVDSDGVLRGVVTLDRVRRALRPAAPAG